MSVGSPLTLRPATRGDGQALWRWRNDRETRRASFDEREIPLEEHLRWLDATLVRPDRRLYVIVAGGNDAGTVRLDLGGDEATVNIAVAPEWRGGGIGRAALRTLCREAFSLGVGRLTARVKPGNAASRAAFEAAGFAVAEEGEVIVLARPTRARVVAAIQARMGSTRLPGKVLRLIAGRPMIGWMAERLRRCREVDEVVISTTLEARDTPVAEFAAAMGVPCVRGSEQDLIERLLRTAHAHRADALVRLTGDCPFVEPVVVDALVRAFRSEPRVDFVTNNAPPSFPHGLDAEVLPTATLEHLDQTVRDAYHREWIPLYVKAHSDDLRIINVAGVEDLSFHRWTVDYSEDLEFAERVFAALGRDNPGFSMRDALEFVARHPEVAAINARHAHGSAARVALGGS